MRVKEWYGWHFPELSKLVGDNQQYARLVLAMGVRENAAEADLLSVVSEDVVAQVKDAAIHSMGVGLTEDDLKNIQSLCEEVVSTAEYRTQLFEYLKNRMSSIAPNLTTMVGELVGARLISHAGSLLSLAKAPASTIQILGAEKALFRALKEKEKTPKYGLIYHATLVGQASTAHKGKIARITACRAALATRVDALAEGVTGPTIGVDGRESVEYKLRRLESGEIYSLSGEHKKGKTSNVPAYSRIAEQAKRPETHKPPHFKIQGEPQGEPQEEGEDVEMTKEQRKAAKRARKEAESTATSGSEETKEERKARKKAKKAAQADEEEE
eukprot:NODE_1590_length_1120_cov_178.241830_g1296_i0.p1 GENE.NODE_1590_length_1120_cov_178.241830_g1296_i0~~NODE_1590_length_1120_cov_178.241830_g1296_i0.p1  ORF type:complete len:340 (+),score=135.55 NODE_1590_length_1120_cov_178.241830_g1296_i0:41-1021(+)